MVREGQPTCAVSRSMAVEAGAAEVLVNQRVVNRSWAVVGGFGLGSNLLRRHTVTMVRGDIKREERGWI